MSVGQANTDIHNFGHYLVKLLDTNSLYWDKLESISPDYDLLNDHNENYFVKTMELMEAKQGFIVSSHAYGRKLNIRGKNIILVYNEDIDAEYLTDNPFSVAVNRESDSIYSLLINFNAFVKLVAKKDYNGIYSFFATFYSWLCGKETPQTFLYAILTYIDVVYHNLNLEKVKSFIDFNIAKSTDIIQQVLMTKFNIPNPHRFTSDALDIMELDNNSVFAELFYYPRYTKYLIKAGSVPEFNLKGFIAMIEEAFEDQVTNLELRNTLLSTKYFNDAEMVEDKEAKYTKVVFKDLLEFEPRFEGQIDLLFKMSDELMIPTMDIIYKTIDDCIEKHGIKKVTEEDQESKKLELESDIEKQIRESIEAMQCKE